MIEHLKLQVRREVLQQKPGPEHMYDHRCEGFCVENMYNCTDRF